MRTTTRERFWRVPLDVRDMPRVKGTVYIQEERCKGCAYCVEFCPRGVLGLSQRFNSKGYHPPDQLQPDACTACKLCQILCPEFAIGVQEVTYMEAGHAS